MASSEVDFRLDGFEPADTWTEQGFERAFEFEPDCLTVLAEHHTPDGAQSFYVLHNSAVAWGIPGAPQLLALHLRRNAKERTFSFEHTELPLPAMAQSWLIHRGCPREAMALRPDIGTEPKDKTTRALEQRIMGDGNRFSLVHSYTHDDPDDMTTLVVLYSLDEHTPARFRVLHEETDLHARTHSLREGGFATRTEALDWCEARLEGVAALLPPVPRVAPLHRPSNTLPPPLVRGTSGHHR